MRTVPLDEAASGVVDGTGAVSVRLGPTRAGQTWKTSNVAVFGNSTLSPDVRYYLGSTSPGNYLGGSYDANNDNADIVTVLRPGQYVTARFTNGTPGATMTLSLYGTMEVPG